jgi:transposase
MSRTILAPIDANRRKGCELSPFLRGSIQTWAAVGLTREEIAKKTFLTPSTVKSTLQRNQFRDHGKTLDRPGRPPLLTTRDKRLILCIIRKSPKIKYKDLAKEAGLDCSHDTLYRFLKSEGIET